MGKWDREEERQRSRRGEEHVHEFHKTGVYLKSDAYEMHCGCGVFAERAHGDATVVRLDRERYEPCVHNGRSQRYPIVGYVGQQP